MAFLSRGNRRNAKYWNAEKIWTAAFAVTFSGCTSVPITQPVQDVLVAQVYIEADYDAVWNRFTRADGFADWYSVPCREFSTQPGAPLAWGVGDKDIYRGRLLRISRGEEIVWEFRFLGFGFDEPMTTAAFEIVERGETVLVSLRHDVTGAPETSAMISPVGWTKLLSRLKTLLESGTPMPWPEDERSSLPMP